jgi:predicted nuclease of predicted toxin-antitoxin system
MLRLLADENFNGDIVRALLLRQPDLDIVRVQDVGLAGLDDPDILDWAAANDRIILTHDRATLPITRMSAWPLVKRCGVSSS